MLKSKCGLLLASPVGTMLFQSQMLRVSSNVHLAGICLKPILLCIVINYGWKQLMLVGNHPAGKEIGPLFGSDKLPQMKDKRSSFKGKICPFPLINLYLFREMSLRGRDTLNIFASIYLENQTRVDIDAIWNTSSSIKRKLQTREIILFHLHSHQSWSPRTFLAAWCRNQKFT